MYIFRLTFLIQKLTTNQVSVCSSFWLKSALEEEKFVLISWLLS